mgnify:CR=1 FL=1
MDWSWLINAFTQPSAVQAIIIISLVSAFGLMLGKLKIGGISLGITFVFFVGILMGHFGIVIDNNMLNLAQSFGLILFVYALGLQVGPGFFSSLKQGGFKLNMLSAALIFTGIATTLLIHFITDISLPNMMGLLCGAVTNTPALGAAQQALLQMKPESWHEVSEMALACATTYPLGVVGVILAIIILKKVFLPTGKNKYATHKKEKTNIAEFLVTNPALYGKTIQDVMQLTHIQFVISRLWRDNKASIPTSDTTRQPNDHLLIISEKEDLGIIRVLFGEQERVDWNKDDIDWDDVDKQLISRKVLVSKGKLNGVRLGALRLRNLYGINITRVNRAGISLLPSPDLHLQIGDRLTIVGETHSVTTVAKLLGNELKSLDHPNLISIFIGITLGLLIGIIPIYIPGITMPIMLGIAGGPIVVGILMGAFGPRFHMATYTTMSANLMLRQLGIVIYLAGLGIQSGAQFFETIFSTQGLQWVGIGFLLTIVPVLIVGFISSKWFGVNYETNVGMICGSMANPMALDYANTTVEGDVPSVSYATVYPMGMFLRVITAQLILMFFL